MFSACLKCMLCGPLRKYLVGLGLEFPEAGCLLSCLLFCHLRHWYVRMLACEGFWPREDAPV